MKICVSRRPGVVFDTLSKDWFSCYISDLLHAVSIADRVSAEFVTLGFGGGGGNPSLVVSLLNCSLLWSMHSLSQHTGGSLPLSLEYKIEGVPIPLWEAKLKPSLI